MSERAYFEYTPYPQEGEEQEQNNVRFSIVPEALPENQADTAPTPNGKTQDDDNQWMKDAPASDSVRLYLNDIGNTPLLNAEEEVELAKRYDAGVVASHYLQSEQHLASLAAGWLAEGRQYITIDELRQELTVIEAHGAAAKRRFMEANLRLTVSIAKKYLGKQSTEHLELMDLITYGNDGLERAVQKFDYTKGYKFSTYATWWIRQAIQRGIIKEGRTIHVPSHIQEDINKIIRARTGFIDEHDREPTNQELADMLHMTVDNVKDHRRWSTRSTSLDAPVEDGAPNSAADTTLQDYIVEDGAADTFETISLLDMQDRVRAALKKGLSERAVRVIALRYGLMDGREYSQSETGRLLGLGKEYVGKIERSAMQQLKDDEQFRHLKDYLD